MHGLAIIMHGLLIVLAMVSLFISSRFIASVNEKVLVTPRANQPTPTPPPQPKGKEKEKKKEELPTAAARTR